VKTVLFITYFFPPLAGAGVPRSLKFAKYLPDFGWKPIVISAAESVNYPKDYSLLEEVPGELEVHRVGHRESRFKEWQYARTRLKLAFDFPDNFRSWYSPAYREAKGILRKEKVDLIFSSSAPFTSHFVAMKLKKEFNVPWVADFRDPWFGNYGLNVYYNKTLTQPLIKILATKIKNAERDILKTADKIIVVSWHQRQQLCELHQVAGGKVDVITNGYDESDFDGIKTQSLYPDRLVITFTGSFYLGFKELALDFSDVLREVDKKVELVFIGKAATEMQDVGMDSLTCIYNIPRDKMLAFASASDFLFIVFVPSSPYIVSGKIFEYLRLGKPILALVPEEGDAAKIIKEANAGFILSYDKETMKNQLKEIFEKHRGGMFKDFQPSWEYIRQFERKKLTQKLGGVFDEVIR
jgi:glycosyltransferase involved in cell wall biosynthesis